MNSLASAYWSTESLDELRQRIWATLAAAVQDASHPWRTGTLASFSLGMPDARTVVLRGVDEDTREILSFSDARARKVKELRVNPMAAWCFYQPGLRVQVRLRGTTRLHVADAMARKIWDTLPGSHHQLYASVTEPGARLVTPWEIQFGQRPMENFAVLATTVEEIDWLWLAEERHRRARYAWEGGAWRGHWAVP
jgi:pyridoxamine 5'-phosphate oxidase